MSLLMGPSMGSMALAPIGPVFVRLLGGRWLRLTAPGGLFGRAGQADAGGKTARPSSRDLLPARLGLYLVYGIFRRDCDERGRRNHGPRNSQSRREGDCGSGPQTCCLTEKPRRNTCFGGSCWHTTGEGAQGPITSSIHPRRQARLSRFPARSAAFSILRCLTAAKVRNAVAESGVTRAAILTGVF
jgi:hypothetical protein